MGSRVQCFAIFLLQLLLSSGSSVGEIPTLEGIQENDILGNKENQILYSSSAFTTQLDTTTGTVPVINPMTPTITTPTVVPMETPPSPVTALPAPATTTTPTSSGGSWCIASPSASQTALQVALDYACGYGGTDCSAIQPGASCYNPNTLRDHASYAFNNYYQKNPIPTSCVFGGTAQLINTDPSNGNCHFTAPKTATSTSPPVTQTPTTMTPPSMLTPPTTTTTTPYGPYGVASPTGLPSSATSTSLSLLLLVAAAIVGSLLAVNL